MILKPEWNTVIMAYLIPEWKRSYHIYHMKVCLNEEAL